MTHRLFQFVIIMALMQAGCSAGTESPRIWGSFTERGLATVDMKPGANVRVFNDVQLDDQAYIKYDKTTGYLTLEPGTYRVDGWSLTLFGWNMTAEEKAATYPAPGYAFLYNADDKKIELLASLQDPQDAVPSSLTGVIKVAKTTRYYLAHQNGEKVDGIKLQLYDERAKLPDGTVSTSHAFAQLLIERL